MLTDVPFEDLDDEAAHCSACSSDQLKQIRAVLLLWALDSRAADSAWTLPAQSKLLNSF
jgi:hypothetical protein